MIDKESITKSQFKSYYQGSEMVVAGKLADVGINVSNVNLKIFGDSVNGSLTLTGRTLTFCNIL